MWWFISEQIILVIAEKNNTVNGNFPQTSIYKNDEIKNPRKRTKRMIKNIQKSIELPKMIVQPISKKNTWFFPEGS